MDALVSWQDENKDLPQRLDNEHVEVWLLGQPPLRKYLSYVIETSIGGRELTESAVIDEWRAANDYYAELEASEAGIADDIGHTGLDPALQPYVDRLVADARWTRAYKTLPTRIAMVELARLVVAQQFIGVAHSQRLEERLGQNPSPQQLLEFSLPLDREEPPVQMRKAGSNKFLFWSESSDLRFHEPAVLRPDQVKDYAAFGPVGGIIGLTVGYGSNFLNVIESDGRMLLHNGYHRAYTLLRMGITHAPAIVQTVTRRDELALAASRSVNDDPAFYFKAARPPVLKDFFDPKIRKILRVPKVLRMIELSYEVNEIEVVDFATAGPVR